MKKDKRPLEVIQDGLEDILWSEHEIRLRNIIRDFEKGKITQEEYKNQLDLLGEWVEEQEEEVRKEALKIKGIPDDEWW